ncbi:MAG: aminomethyl transferase family protein, partial [Mesorhizobium sp.]
VRNGVGLSEISNFAKYRVTGEGAAGWLDRIFACKLPKRGSMTLAPMLKDDGRLIGDFTLANIDDAEWFVAGSGIAEQYHMRWFEAHLPKDGSVRIEALGQKLTGLAIAGPKAREVLAKVTRADVSNAGFPFMAVARMDIGLAPC